MNAYTHVYWRAPDLRTSMLVHLMLHTGECCTRPNSTIQNSKYLKPLLFIDLVILVGSVKLIINNPRVRDPNWWFSIFYETDYGTDLPFDHYGRHCTLCCCSMSSTSLICCCAEEKGREGKRVRSKQMDSYMCHRIKHISTHTAYGHAGTCRGILKGLCSVLEKRGNTFIFVTATATPPPPAHIPQFFLSRPTWNSAAVYCFKKKL